MTNGAFIKEYGKRNFYDLYDQVYIILTQQKLYRNIKGFKVFKRKNYATIYGYNESKNLDFATIWSMREIDFKSI